MNKAEHIDQVHEMLGEVFREKIEKPTVEAAINTAYNQIISDLKKSGKTDFTLCRKRFNSVAVTHDTTNDIYYSTYPAALVPKLDMNMIVNSMQAKGYRIAPATEETMLLTDILPVNSVDTSIYYTPKRERIEYYNMESLDADDILDGATPTPTIPNVRMDLAIEFREFEATDEVYMPDGRDYEIKQLAIDMLKAEPIIDQRND